MRYEWSETITSQNIQPLTYHKPMAGMHPHCILYRISTAMIEAWERYTSILPRRVMKPAHTLNKDRCIEREGGPPACVCMRRIWHCVQVHAVIVKTCKIAGSSEMDLEYCGYDESTTACMREVFGEAPSMGTATAAAACSELSLKACVG